MTYTFIIHILFFQVLSGNLTSMKQKSFILVILSSIKNSTVSAKILKYVVSLLATPFSTPKIPHSEKELLTEVCNFYNHIIYFILCYSVLFLYFLYL